jgi:putative ribosome biogenesis GTPase RsgA
MESIMKIFAEKDQNEIKKAFKDIIVSQFATELENMDMHLFNPDMIDEMIFDAFEEVVEDVKAEFKRKLTDKMLSFVEDNNIEKLITLKKKLSV